MLQLVKIALLRPLTFVVMAILIVLFGSIAWIKTPTDIFPDIKVPVIAAVWTYNGLSPKDMSGRIIYNYERQLTATVNDIEHMESSSYNGIGVVKIFFQPGVDIRTATAQVTSTSQTVLKQMPAGTTPPLILNYNASTVPILQIALSSGVLSEQQLFDLGQNTIRSSLATVQGAALPSPYGGRVRQIQIDLDPQALQARHLSPADVGAALASQNQIIPAGTARIGTYEYNVNLNNAPEAIDALNDLPIKTVDGATVTMRDVAHVRDGSPPQQNKVRVDGQRSVLMTMLKNGSASTLDIVDGTKAMLTQLKPSLPDGVNIDLLSDQSLFVKGAAISGVAREGVIAAALTSLMILLFLGSWRSTLIIAASIPLAILAAVCGLLADGRDPQHHDAGRPGAGGRHPGRRRHGDHREHQLAPRARQGQVQDAIMDGARQIVLPAFVSLLCICIVFVPMFFLDGVARFLFVPMAKAVIFAMIASFVLSRTLVPTMGNWLLRAHAGPHTTEHMAAHDATAGEPETRNPFRRFQHGFEKRFESVRRVYIGILLTLALARRKPFVIGFMSVVLVSFALVPFLGRNFFPTVDSGQISHARPRAGRHARGGDRRPVRPYRAAHPPHRARRADRLGGRQHRHDRVGHQPDLFEQRRPIGSQDGDILISLKEDHAPTAGYVRKLREVLPRAFPGTSFAFLPADIVSQILNFGAPAPIDVVVSGKDNVANETYANEVAARMKHIGGIADARLQQPSNYPEFKVEVDRTQANQLGITEQDVTNSLVGEPCG